MSTGALVGRLERLRNYYVELESAESLNSGQAEKLHDVRREIELVQRTLNERR